MNKPFCILKHFVLNSLFPNIGTVTDDNDHYNNYRAAKGILGRPADGRLAGVCVCVVRSFDCFYCHRVYPPLSKGFKSWSVQVSTMWFKIIDNFMGFIYPRSQVGEK